MTAIATNRADRKRRPQMTPDEARAFETLSIASASQVSAGIDARRKAGQHLECRCSAYDHVFTFRRWKALGFSVRKGEKAIRIASFTPLRNKDGEPDESLGLRHATLCLFCRCQVEADAGR